MAYSNYKLRALAEITSLLSEGYIVMLTTNLNGVNYMTLRHVRNKNTIRVRWSDQGYTMAKNGAVIKSEP